jgi:hypothetical protein
MSNGTPGSAEKRPSADRTRWVSLLLVAIIGVSATSAFALALKLPTSLIVWADLVLLCFFAIPLLTGTVGEAGVLTRHRSAVFFGVIPAVAAGGAVVLLALGMRGMLLLYLITAVILVGNLAYWIWFDRRKAG